jgi:hypothetical protein
MELINRIVLVVSVLCLLVIQSNLELVSQKTWSLETNQRTVQAGTSQAILISASSQIVNCVSKYQHWYSIPRDLSKTQMVTCDFPISYIACVETNDPTNPTLECCEFAAFLVNTIRIHRLLDSNG